MCDLGKHPANGLTARVPPRQQCFLRLTATLFSTLPSAQWEREFTEPSADIPSCRPRHRANGHSLSRHRFAWYPFQRRQLQDGGVLTLAQPRDQDNFPIGKLKRVVMHGWLV